ncbi:anti-sigma factor antagonist [Actinomadura darangshiensis]|uniref:Anti-sigma factor antagonist n=1 Tax=Actinomadura darangshiensis TaxID=705336 RepID=A0A4R5AVM6_9ACTN|nr:STAS domain-containing protein [Actinomadura darangshiensis]TDD76843.1 anti-sigma factor antagonist [Actinomadura darangshiensis]
MAEEFRRAGRTVRRAPEVRCRAGAVQAPAVPGDPGARAGLRLRIARVRGDTAVVSVAGEIDLRTAGALRDRLVELHAERAREAPGEGPHRLVADFTAVSFCDAAGLGALVAAHNQIAAAGGEIALAGVRPAQLRLLRITGLHRLFAVHRDTGAALSDVQLSGQGPSVRDSPTTSR